MIAETDSVSLAPGVALLGDRLADHVRGGSWPLNRSGEFVLGRLGHPVGLIVRETADAFSLPPEVARADVLRFVWRLNSLALVNVDSEAAPLRRLASWTLLAVRLAPSGALPGSLARRRALDTSGVGPAILSTLVAVLPRISVVAAVATALALPLSLLAGADLAVPLVLGLVTAAGLGLHEALHAAALRGVPSSLVTHGRRTYVLHAHVGPGRRCAVALAGPLAVAALGVGLLVGGAATGAPVLMLAGCPLSAHALAVTVASSDGRAACGL